MEQLVISAAGATRAADRISAAFHVLMSAALLTMTWRSEPAAAVWLQTALFGCAMSWFGLASPDRGKRFRAGRLPGLHHALMAAAMIWMITTMPAVMPMAPAGPAHAPMRAMASRRSGCR
jgi:hypothetical protein